MTGFDDSPMEEWRAPDLSSLRIPYDAFGPAIVEALSTPDKASQIVLQHRIIEWLTHSGDQQRSLQPA
jgi:LacI family transcriptional regulator